MQNGKKSSISGLFNKDLDIAERKFIVGNRNISLYFIDC